MYETQMLWLKRMQTRLATLAEGVRSNIEPEVLEAQPDYLATAYRMHHVGPSRRRSYQTLSSLMDLHQELRERFSSAQLKTGTVGLVEQAALEDLGYVLDCSAVAMHRFTVISHIEASRVTFEGKFEDFKSGLRVALQSQTHFATEARISDVRFSDLQYSDVIEDAGDLGTFTASARLLFQLDLYADEKPSVESFVGEHLRVQLTSTLQPMQPVYLPLLKVAPWSYEVS